LFQAQPQPAGLRFVIWRPFRCIFKPLCIAQEKHVHADKNLDGRKKTSSNLDIEDIEDIRGFRRRLEETPDGLRGFRADKAFFCNRRDCRRSATALGASTIGARCRAR
jgi:hypothetical protein